MSEDWKGRAPSPKQMDYLTHYRLPVPSNQEQANDIIYKHYLERKAAMGGTSDEPTEKTEAMEKPEPRKVPTYGREKADELIKLIGVMAQTAAENNASTVQLNLDADDLLVLSDMLQEMDRHLPDFFEG